MKIFLNKPLPPIRITTPKFIHVFSLGLGATLLLNVCFQQSEALASRPFWADSPSYIEGDFLYVVGKVSQAASVEEGRQQALLQGKFELMNFTKISEVSAEGLNLESRHIHIEKNQDGTVNVYQLLRIHTEKVVEVQTRLRDKSQPHKEAFESARQDLINLHTSLVENQKELERQTHSVQETIAYLKEMQRKLTVKAEEIDQYQNEVAQVTSHVEEKIQTIDQQKRNAEKLLRQLQTINQVHTSTLQNLQDMERDLDGKEKEIARLHQIFRERVERSSLLACSHITPGMTPSEVRSLIGPPSGEKHSYANERYDTWAYGTAKVNFDSQAVVDSITGCPKKK